jgi:DNA-binding PadR family transcriptional regulator
MKPASDLRLLTLCVLQRQAATNLTRYQVMTNINQIISEILPPYSPGAVYHELRLLQRDKMVTINHNAFVNITELGKEFLHRTLLETPTPAPLLSLVMRVLAILLIENNQIRETGVHKLQIELIKYNQKNQTTRQIMSDIKLSPKSELCELTRHLKKTITSFVAQL